MAVSICPLPFLAAWRSTPLVWAALVCLLLVSIARAADQPNIILLTTNHQAPRMTGFEGNTQIQTPNLDQLAKDGVFFPRCYTPTVQDAPGQAAILTGQYPHNYNITDKQPNLSERIETFSKALHRAGYVCAIVGRWEPFGEKSFEPDHGFADYTAICAPSSWTSNQVRLQGKETKLDKPLTEWIADRAVEYVEKSHEKPFLLWVNFVEPPEPLTLPSGVENSYPADKIELPKSVKTTPERRPAILLNTDLVKKFQPMDEAKVREARSKYYAMMTYTDSQIGRVLKQVDDPKLRENTVVVFASNNGWALGDHQLFSTGPAFYEELVRGPLVIRYPKLTKSGTKIERIVSLVDLAPTFLELAGLEVPLVMQGQSLLPVLHDPETESHRDEAFIEFTSAPGEPACTARAIVTDFFKYIEYAPSDVHLFDLKRDSEELHNAASDMEYASVVKVLSTRLKKWQEVTKDPGFRK